MCACAHYLRFFLTASRVMLISFEADSGTNVWDICCWSSSTFSSTAAMHFSVNCMHACLLFAHKPPARLLRCLVEILGLLHTSLHTLHDLCTSPAHVWTWAHICKPLWAQAMHRCDWCKLWHRLHCRSGVPVHMHCIASAWSLQDAHNSEMQVCLQCLLHSCTQCMHPVQPPWAHCLCPPAQLQETALVHPDTAPVPSVHDPALSESSLVPPACCAHGTSGHLAGEDWGIVFEKFHSTVMRLQVLDYSAAFAPQDADRLVVI